MHAPEGDNGFVTVGSLLSWLPSLGLPHFQRGQVWRSDSISLLLESLMLDTPCGSVILWRPPGPLAEHGEPVPAWGTENPQLLVVDGQQRLTALALVFASRQRWALNLAALPEFREAADRDPERRHRERPLFTPIPGQPPVSASASKIARYEASLRDLVPLDVLEDRGIDAWPYQANPSDIGQGATWAGMVAGVQAIRQRRLQVVIRREDSLRSIVELYNRINSAGVTVRQEEKAFAAMVAVEPRAAAWLRDCFTATHPHKVVGTEPGDLTHNTVVNRERERSFGFPLYIRTFAQAAAHHLDRDGADLDLLPRLHSDGAWLGAGPAREQVLDQSLAVVATTGRVLREVLHCDDYRFLPAADPLRPVFALLLKYPQIEDELVARALLACQIEALRERPMPVREQMRQIRGSHRLEHAIRALPAPDVENTHDALAGTLAIQSGWVSLLYWYQRSHEARDYGGWFHPLTVHSRAHREHIVPFSLLHPAFPDLPASGQARSHEANAIGNLTFLSEQFNFDHGADPIDLEAVNPHLLMAHHLDDPQVLTAYRAATTALSDGRHEDGVRAFRQFRAHRTQQLAEGMRTWLQQVLSYEPHDPGMQPTPQLVRPSTADHIRQNGWPPAFRDAVLQVVGDMPLGAKTHWVLARSGNGRARSRISHQIRLAESASKLMIGCDVDGAEQIAERLAARIGLHRDERPHQWVFTPVPDNPSSTLCIQDLDALLNSRDLPPLETPGPSKVPSQADMDRVPDDLPVQGHEPGRHALLNVTA